MFNNNNKGINLIGSEYEKYSYFTDMEYVSDNKPEDPPLYVAQTLFKKLAVQYPNSFFILNIRNKNNWLKSRINHGEGQYLKNIAEKLRMTYTQVINKWSNDWDNHLKNVTTFFRNSPNRLLVFNIENDNIDKLIWFFKKNAGLELDKQYYLHLGKSKYNIINNKILDIINKSNSVQKRYNNNNIGKLNFN